MTSNEARTRWQTGWPAVLVATAASLSLLLFGVATMSLSDAVGAAKKKPPRLDLTALPLGDGKVISSGPRRGYLLSCQRNFPGGGPAVNGPWIHGSTYDMTAKYVVDGAVSWPGTFQATVARSGVTLVGNGLPNHPTGVFPVARTDDAFVIDRNPNQIAPYALNKALNGSPRRGAPQCVGGAVGVAKSGVPIFNAVDAAGRDAIAHEVQDSCSGHPQQGGVYHYHGLPACLSAGKKEKRSGLLGWALDGFPILRPTRRARQVPVEQAARRLPRDQERGPLSGQAPAGVPLRRELRVPLHGGVLPRDADNRQFRPAAGPGRPPGGPVGRRRRSAVPAPLELRRRR